METVAEARGMDEPTSGDWRIRKEDQAQNLKMEEEKPMKETEKWRSED